MIEHTETDGTDDIGPHVLVATYEHRYGNTYAELHECGGRMIGEPDDEQGDR